MDKMDEVMLFAVEVAEYVPGWDLDRATYHERDLVQWVNPEIPGAAIRIRRTRGRKRVRVFGAYPHGHAPREEESVAITVSMERPVEVVARDIQRRCVTPYLVAYQAAVARAYQAAMDQARVQDLADELAAIVGQTAKHTQGCSQVWTRHGTFVVNPGSQGPYITVQRMYGLSTEAAVEIARVLARY
jgi:transcription initiation factor TFIIIB Brf1 subunit/transcription initiation factor TFIIB